MRALLLPLLLSTVATTAAAAPTTTTYKLITAAGPIGTLSVVEDGSVVDTDFKVDDNGRGSKLKEHLTLGKDGLPLTWDIEGKGWFGAPVKEKFKSDGKQASWVSLDDKGEAAAADAVYVANNGTPFAQQLYLRALLAKKDRAKNVLPSGSMRLEKVRDVDVGEGKDKEKLTAYALWGLDVQPGFLLARGDRFVGNLYPGWVFVEEKHAAQFEKLSALAAELSRDALQTLTKKLTHAFDGPLWIMNARVFDPKTGQLSEPQNVGVYNDVIVSMGKGAAPADAAVVDAAGGTLLPGLFDSHAHLSDWSGPMHLAAGVTFTRDPGNDNDTLLALEKDVQRGELMGPRTKKSGFLEGKSPFSAHLGFVIDSVDEAKAKVNWYADHGYWGVKLYNSMNPAFVKPIAEEAHRRGLHVSGHIPAFMSSQQAVTDGYDEINHINQLLLMFIIDINNKAEDPRTPFRFTAVGERLHKLDLKSPAFQQMLKLMKQKKTALDPTLATFSPVLMARPGKTTPADAQWLEHMPVTVQRARKSAVLDVKPEQYETYDKSWQKLEEVLLLLHKEGIVLVPGTDDYAGVVLHSELESWVKAGIAPSAALSSATLGSAQFLGTQNLQGTIAPGMWADLYLVDGDPTKDINIIRKGTLVVTRGNYYLPAEIHTSLGMKPFAKAATVKAPEKKK